jgi:hypothetical protein
MKREDLFELKRLLAQLRTTHPEYEIVLTENKMLAEMMYNDMHAANGQFSMPLEMQVDICIDDKDNNNL